MTLPYLDFYELCLNKNDLFYLDPILATPPRPAPQEHGGPRGTLLRWNYVLALSSSPAH